MKVREIFALLVCCRECTEDEKGKDGAMVRKYHIDEAEIRKTIDLKKALDSLKDPVRTEVENYRKKVLNNRFVYMTKYPELVTKAQKMFDPADYQKEKNKKPLVINSNTKEKPVVQEGDKT